MALHLVILLISKLLKYMSVVPSFRSVDYVINGFYKNHITVFAEVVPVALSLSTHSIMVEPILGLPAEAGIKLTLHKMPLRDALSRTKIFHGRYPGYSDSTEQAKPGSRVHMETCCRGAWHCLLYTTCQW